MAIYLDALEIVIQGRSILGTRSDFGDRNQLSCLVRDAESRITTPQIKKLLPLAKKINMISSESFAHTPSSYVKDYFFPD